MTGVRHAVHGRARQRTSSISIVLILMLASTAVAVGLAVAQAAVILRPLPYRDSGRLTGHLGTGPAHGNVIEIAHRNYVDWPAQRASSLLLPAGR